MKNIPIGVQLYSVREDCKKDLPGTLQAVAKMGYAGVEFAGYYNYSAKDLRKLLDDNGLKCCGTHTPLDSISSDNLKATIEFNQTLGNKFLIVPWIPEEKRKTKADWAAMGKFFADAAAKAKASNMRVGYHNHHVEFQDLEGEKPWDTFFKAAGKDVVMQLDTGNALHGKADPVPYLSRFPGQAATVHLKEFSETKKNVLIGEGDVRWKEVFTACESIGNTEWYIVEQESYAHAPIECIKRCLENLKKMRSA